MANHDERSQILSMLESGKITASQALELLEALNNEDGPAELVSPLTEPEPLPAEPPQMEGSQDVDLAPLQAEGSQSSAQPVIEQGSAEMPPDSTEAQAASTEERRVETGTVIGPGAGSEPAFARWKRWLWIPLAVGLSVTVIGGLFLFWSYMATGISFWFACSWFPFLLGVFILALAAAGRSVRWLHLRVHQQQGEWPRTIAISLPLPLGLASWFVRTFRGYIPGLQRVDLEQAFDALKHTSADQPFYLEVNEEDSGERVEIFIG